jgi:SAM-dependent methyltransferase
MKKFERVCLLALTLTLLFSFSLTSSLAQEFEPYSGQPGKDVIWVPTPEDQAEVMLDLAEVTAADYVIDLGSGDGRIVIAAAKRGARALGIEFNPDMVKLSEKNAEKAGVSDRASFIQADIFESDFSKASVITMYLLPDLNLKLRPKILDMEPGTRVVSHAFNMGDWEADKSVTSGGRYLYLWTVPARVDGDWTWMENNNPAALHLDQKFQFIEGTIATKKNACTIQDAKLRGDQIAFTCGKQYYSGQITLDQIRGIVQYQTTESEWIATRKLQPEE